MALFRELSDHPSYMLKSLDHNGFYNNDMVFRMEKVKKVKRESPEKSESAKKRKAVSEDEDWSENEKPVVSLRLL